MPPQKGTDQDALVPGTFVPYHAKPRSGKRSANVGWVITEGGCHIWQGGRRSDGYGQVRVGGKQRGVHRVRYEREVGPVPEGMVLDHFACDNGAGGCCNPLHVRPVSHRENVLRGDTVTATNAAKTHCSRGHPYSGGNLYVNPRGYRHCRACDRTRHSSPEYLARRRERRRLSNEPRQ